MASIDMGGPSGRKRVDQELPLVPFIDLLFCCIMFLLATAVWNQLAKIPIVNDDGGPVSADAPVPDQEMLVVEVHEASVGVGFQTGAQHSISDADGLNADALRARFSLLREMDPRRRNVVVRVDDGIPYARVMAVLDETVAFFPDLSLRGAE